MAKKSPRKITKRALYQRIARKIRNDGEELQVAHGDGPEDRCQVIDVQRDFIKARHPELERLGRDLGVIGPSEELAQEHDPLTGVNPGPTSPSLPAGAVRRSMQPPRSLVRSVKPGRQVNTRPTRHDIHAGMVAAFLAVLKTDRRGFDK